MKWLFFNRWKKTKLDKQSLQFRNIQIVDPNFVYQCIQEHIKITGEKPAEILLPTPWFKYADVKITFHNEPWCATFDGQKLIQHPNPPGI